MKFSELVENEINIQNILNKIDNLSIRKALLDIQDIFKIKKSTSKTIEIVYFKDFKDDIEKIARNFNLSFGPVDSNKQHIGILVNADNLTLKIRATGVKEGSTKGSADLQEIGVIIALDCLINQIDIQDYEKFKNKNVYVNNNEQIINSINFLINNKNWSTQCFKSAELIFKNVKNIKNYEFHQSSKLFNEIRKVGKELSGLKEDKWNPSDIYLVSKHGFKSPSSFKNIIDYNNYISSDTDFIGISLKGEKALHGSFALSNIKKMLKLNFDDSYWNIKDYTLDNKQKEKILHAFKLLKSHKFSKIYVFNNKSNNLRDCINNFNIKSDVWGKSYPQVLQMLASLKQDDDLHKLAYLAYCGASSILPQACNHNKCTPSKFYRVENGLDISKFDLIRCRIPLNGDMGIIFDVCVNGKIQKLQARSKGSASQFMIINAVENAANTPLSVLTI